MSVPRTTLLLLSGMPGVGKSSFGRYLAREYSFAHYDLECHPRGWPHPELKAVWDSSRKNFVGELTRRHERVALDWGFPAGAIHWVNELLAEGVRLVWFAADIALARALFIERGGIDIAHFETQVQGIERAGLPKSLPCVKVEALTAAGAIRDPAAILRDIFGQ